MGIPIITIRNQNNINFTTVDNYFIKDKTLSTKAKGMLIQLLALPDGWQLSKGSIQSLVKEGREFCESCIKELKEHDYIILEKYKNSKTGSFEYEYQISAIPFCCEYLPDGELYNTKTNEIGRGRTILPKKNYDSNLEIVHELTNIINEKVYFEGTIDELKVLLPKKYHVYNGVLSKLIRNNQENLAEIGILFEFYRNKKGTMIRIGDSEFVRKNKGASENSLTPPLTPDNKKVQVPDTGKPYMDLHPQNIDEIKPVQVPDTGNPYMDLHPSKNGVRESAAFPYTEKPYAYKRMNNKKIDIRQIEKGIKENVRLSDLLAKHTDPNEQEKIKAMVEIIIDVLSMSQDQIRIGNEMYATGKVKERLLTITDEHIEYILENLQRITHPIKNIRSYLMKSLYTAPLSKNFSDYSKRRNIEDFPSWYGNTRQTEPDEQLINEVKEIQKRLKIEEQESDPKLESEIQHMLQDIEKKGIRV